MSDFWSHSGEALHFSRGVHQKVLQHSAVLRGVAVRNLSGHDTVYRLEHLGESVWFNHHLPSLTTATAREFGDNKPVAKSFLERAAIQTPKGKHFSRDNIDNAWVYAEKTLGFPVVLKPLSGTGGDGVTSMIETRDHFDVGWKAASVKSRIIVEQHIVGKDYRLLVVGNKFVAATWREPLSIVGDGVSSVNQLIDAKSELRKSNPYLAGKTIKLNENNVRTLKEHGYDSKSILPSGKKLFLQSIANVGAGGDSYDATDYVHDDFKQIAIRACNAIPGFALAGIDILVPDITKPAKGQRYGIVELNAKPDIALHHFPVYGTARDAAGAIVEYLFPLARIIPMQSWRSVSVQFKGKVTGVGFRKKCSELATLNGIFGQVKNVDDGVVDAEFHGTNTAIDRIISTLVKAYKCDHTNTLLQKEKPIKFNIVE